MCAFGPISSGRPAMDDGDDDCYDYDGHDHWPYCTRSLVFILILGVCTRAILLSSSLSLEEMFNILFSPIFLVSGQTRTLVRRRRWPHSIKSQTINTTIDTLTVASTRPSRAGHDHGPMVAVITVPLIVCVCLRSSWWLMMIMIGAIHFAGGRCVIIARWIRGSHRHRLFSLPFFIRPKGNESTRQITCSHLSFVFCYPGNAPLTNSFRCLVGEASLCTNCVSRP